jgi:truncated hemoglobin YjbI
MDGDSMTTLFDKYGGLTTFHKITTTFYQTLLDSPQVSHFFAGVDIKLLTEHQTNFLASALGGPNLYKGHNIKEAHSHIKVSEADFAEVVMILEEALEGAGVEEQDIITIIETIAPFKKDIVNA